MSFWTPPIVGTLLTLGALLALGQLVERYLAMPAAILAGMLGLLLGPEVLGWIGFDTGVLETGVYHALGIVFICVALVPSREGGPRGQATTMALGISVMVTLQSALGLGLALLLGVHAGFGLLLPLGFEQGPGQALSLGAAWEASGLPQGGQVGLIIAAIGFGWAVLAGVPLAHLGSRLGFRRDATGEREILAPPLAPGAVSRVLSIVAVLYALTWMVCAFLADLLAGMPDIAAMVWGFHFLLGAMIASTFRALLDRSPYPDLVDGGALTQISGATVDLATVAALAAVQVSVFTAWWLPILVITTAGGLVTLIACVALARAGFREDRFEHALLWYGMSTGTLPIGLALLRVVDPDLRSAAPTSAVYGSALAILGVAPVVLVLHPMAIAGQPTLAFGLCVVWVGVLMGVWVGFFGLGRQPLDS